MIVIVLAVILANPSADVDRIQNHLAQVEVELRGADVSALGAAQVARRARLIDELRVYRERGVFPRNVERPVRSPIFVDPWGVRCAMAHLIETSGHGALVARIAATRNPAYIAELAGDSELRAWLAAHGLSAAEAARIQPSYAFEVGESCDIDERCISRMCLRIDPQLAYCTEPCDPDQPSACPVGLLETPMTCTALSDEPAVCRYPDPAPLGLGWPCADDPDACIGPCLIDAAVPTCTYYCSTAAECPAGYDCQLHGDAMVCLEHVPDSGCTASGSPPGAAAALAVLLAIALRRRPRPTTVG